MSGTVSDLSEVIHLIAEKYPISHYSETVKAGFLENVVHQHLTD